MRKTIMIVLMVVAIMTMAMPVYAQGGSAPSSAKDWAVPIGAGLSMAIASGLCGLAQGRATASAAEAVGRNPGAREGIQFMLILGLVLIESLALYVFAVVFLKVT